MAETDHDDATAVVVVVHHNLVVAVIVRAASVPVDNVPAVRDAIPLSHGGKIAS
jgi:hypothetical protein